MKHDANTHPEMLTAAPGPQDINWYPGHMSKTRRRLEEDVRRVDACIQLLDARIPRSSQNPVLAEIIGEKPCLTVFNRADQADPEVTALWRKAFPVSVETTASLQTGVGAVVPAIRRLLADTLTRYEAKGQVGRSLKLMVVGVPNVGKSTFINSLTRKKSLKAEDRPGVTRTVQWMRVDQGLDLLDTPGILWPKLGDPETGMNLAFTGAIKNEILDTTELAMALMGVLRETYPARLTERYKINPAQEGDSLALLEAAARKRGFLISGGELDIDRMALTLLEEFRGGKLGRITLERPQ